MPSEHRGGWPGCPRSRTGWASSSTLLRQADQPDLLLGPAASCYLDAITYAAEHHLAPDIKNAIDTAATRHGLDQAAAWPALRIHLMLIAANGHNAAGILDQAVGLGGLSDARDPAAVVDYRLDLTEANNRTRGPLPWLPAIPTDLLDDPTWKDYLTQRYQLTRQLADEVHQHATEDPDRPRWAEDLVGLDPTLIADIQQWRAAHQTPEADLRPTGAPQPSAAERNTQRRLDHALHTSQAGIREWLPKITTAAPACVGDPGLPALAAHLAHTSQRRPRLDALLTTAAGLGPLPTDHPADALHYRITILIQQQVEMEYHEALTITQAHRPISEPPTTHRPDRDRNRGISI